MKLSFKMISLLSLLLLITGNTPASETKTLTFEDNMYTETSRQSFQVPAQGMLTVDVSEGHLLVESWDREFIDLEVKKGLDVSDQAQAKQAFDTFQVNTRQEETRFYVTSTTGFGGSDLRSLVLSFKIPVRYAVELKTAGGKIKIGDLQGNVKAVTGGGAIEVGTIKNGSVDAKTSGGSIRVQKIENGDGNVKTSGGSLVIGDVSGQLHAKTSGGSINIGYVGGSVKAETAGGSIRVAGSGGDVEVGTNGGNLVVGRTKGLIKARTSGGSISLDEVDQGVEATTSGGNIRLKGAVGPVRLKTSGGNISINKAFGFVEAETQGGSITAELRESLKTGPNHCKIKFCGGTLISHGGEIAVHINDQVQATFDISLNLKRHELNQYAIHSEFPLDISQKKTGWFNQWTVTGTGTLNGGGGLINLSTVGGNVFIKKLNP